MSSSSDESEYCDSDDENLNDNLNPLNSENIEENEDEVDDEEELEYLEYCRTLSINNISHEINVCDLAENVKKKKKSEKKNNGTTKRMLDFSKRENTSGKFRAKCLPVRQKIFNNNEAYPPRFNKRRIYMDELNTKKINVNKKNFPKLGK